MTDKHTKFIHSPDGHITICRRRVHNTVYEGVAKCHPEDYDFESKLVGEHYAYMRALIKEMADRRDAKRDELRALNHLYNILEQNDKVDKESIECYTIRRQIKNIEDEIKDLRELIKITKLELRATIVAKDTYYREVRKRRNKNAE